MTAERVSVAEAARRLGVTEPAVRQRIRRGTLRIERTNGAVWVLGADLPSTEGEDGHYTDSTTAAPPDNSPDSTAVTVALVIALERANALAAEQLAVKDRQIEGMQRQIGELHVLLQQAQRALPAAVAEHLTTPTDNPTPRHHPEHYSPSNKVDSAPQPRAPWWRRVFRGTD